MPPRLACCAERGTCTQSCDCPQLTRPLPVPLAVLTWAAKARLSIRQLLIPLSYCCLLGGLNTTIGTSTNLVVTGEANNRGMDAW